MASSPRRIGAPDGPTNGGMMSDFNSTHHRAVWFDVPAIVLDSEGNRIALHSTVDA
jgi:hypothetical protein